MIMAPPCITTLQEGGFCDRLTPTGYWCRDKANVIYRDLFSGVWVNLRTNPTKPMVAADNTAADLSRRATYVAGCERVLDFGSGTGSFARFLNSHKPGTCFTKELATEWPMVDIDCITMFHVLEHLEDPVAQLNVLHDRYGQVRLVVEVPAAYDPLLCRYRTEAYMDRAFHPEHYVYHTPQSLQYTLSQSKFGEHWRCHKVQRYDRHNHRGWGAPVTEEEYWYGYDTLVMVSY